MKPQDKKELNFILKTAIEIAIATAITTIIIYTTLKIITL
ncbi:hypothetical protein UFOVP530_46 [uncultured Caudovirales phage]|uniref:Uncharacterized protein n=1 Tax=uncultured Caudovirales phage TaxID=2100421 RepID=A0A6J5R684_9CAUD|nr:hypothetical protein UFOVP530_46 [uncultured Caudovirales phage]CAB4179204.1 hypothetical protein UFOVP1027_46 [uncultured Caudovirales phage]CAB4188235.1 hypothetical protein UFOVP1182_12 [uncultured Caudovirales phage]CAB4220525.1 hypothetical protein UFOVP1632_28 [uncultured Caudovirales phage]